MHLTKMGVRLDSDLLIFRTCHKRLDDAAIVFPPEQNNVPNSGSRPVVPVAYFHNNFPLKLRHFFDCAQRGVDGGLNPQSKSHSLYAETTINNHLVLRHSGE